MYIYYQFYSIQVYIIFIGTSIRYLGKNCLLKYFRNFMPLKDGLNRNFSWYGKYKLLNKKHISISSIKKMSQCSSVDRECSICKAKNFSNNYKIENFLFLMLQRSNLDKPFPVLFISPHRIFWSVPSSPRRTHISWSPDKIISLKIKYTCLLLKNGASLSNEVSFQNHIPFYWPI